MFSRIAIANRGEAAMRLIHAVRDINAAGDGRIEVDGAAGELIGTVRINDHRQAVEIDRDVPIGPVAGIFQGDLVLHPWPGTTRHFDAQQCVEEVV